jgi:hypothetical protein
VAAAAAAAAAAADPQLPSGVHAWAYGVEPAALQPPPPQQQQPLQGDAVVAGSGDSGALQRRLSTSSLASSASACGTGSRLMPLAR